MFYLQFWHLFFFFISVVCQYAISNSGSHLIQEAASSQSLNSFLYTIFSFFTLTIMPLFSNCFLSLDTLACRSECLYCVGLTETHRLQPTCISMLTYMVSLHWFSPAMLFYVTQHTGFFSALLAGLLIKWHL